MSEGEVAIGEGRMGEEELPEINIGSMTVTLFSFSLSCRSIYTNNLSKVAICSIHIHQFPSHVIFLNDMHVDHILIKPINHPPTIPPNSPATTSPFTKCSVPFSHAICENASAAIQATYSLSLLLFPLVVTFSPPPTPKY